MTAVDSLLKLDANQPFTASYLFLKRFGNMTHDLRMQTWKSGDVSVMHPNAGACFLYTSFIHFNPTTCITSYLQ
jgi:hypothetical protein